MAVDLPPPLTPQLSTPAAIFAAGDALPRRALSFGRYRLQVLGEHLLDDDALAQAVADAPTLSDAVRALSAAHYRAGWPGVTLHYVLVGETLYLLVLPGRVETVDGDAGLSAHFTDLKGAILTASALEPRRALAAMHAQRSGHAVQMSLEPGSLPGLVRLQLQRSAPLRGLPQLRVGAGNPGNRFVGRDFVDAEIAVGGGGGELRLSRRQDFDGGRRYREHAASVSVVLPEGLFGIDGRRIDYSRELTASGIDGRVSAAGLSWSFLPYADFAQRWIVTLRADAISDVLDSDTGVRLLDESYPSLDGSAMHAWTGLHEAWSLQTQIALTLRRGLGGSSAHSDIGYNSLRSSLRVEAGSADAAGGTLTLDALAQYASDRLPQQQQFVLGGSQALAAWLPGVITGDSGYFIRAAAHRPLVRGRWRARPGIFVEIGGGRAEVGETTPTLADAGAELTLAFGNWLEASVVAATPLLESGADRATTDAARADVYLRVELRY
jgi:hemolysin activation/secretion protein